MILRAPTWLPRSNGSFHLMAPCYFATGKPITNLHCLLGTVSARREDGRFYFRRLALDPAWWPYPGWAIEETEDGTAGSLAMAMTLVEKGLTEERAERPAIEPPSFARTG